MFPRPLAWFLDGALGAGPSAYELLLALALVLGLAALLGAPSLARLSRPRLFAALLSAELAGVLGARWLFWLTSGAPAFDQAGDLPLVAYAGAASGGLTLVAVAWGLALPTRALFDALAPVAALGLALARIGCFLAGCDYGVPHVGPHTVRFPAWAVPGEPRAAAASLVDHAARALVPSDAVTSLAVHPVQLYESLLGLLLFAVLVRVGPRPNSLRLVVLAAGYAFGRFLLELLRGDPDRGLEVLGTPWSTSQFASLVVLVVAIAWISRRGRLQNALN